MTDDKKRELIESLRCNSGCSHKKTLTKQEILMLTAADALEETLWRDIEGVVFEDTKEILLRTTECVGIAWWSDGNQCFIDTYGKDVHG